VTLVLLFLVAVGWAIYLASWLRSRAEQRNVNSISSFNKHLSVLERTSPSRSASPGYEPSLRSPSMSLQAARKRRRDVLFALAGVALVTMVAAVVGGGGFVWIHLLTDALLAGYVVMLARAQRLAVERRTKVRYLAPTASASVAVERPYLLTRSASAN
jgi:hypothetical protein